MAKPLDIPELDTLNLAQAKDEIIRLHKIVESQASELNEIEMKAIAKQNSDFRIGGLKQFQINIESEASVRVRTSETSPKYCFWLDQDSDLLNDALVCTEYHLKMFAKILGLVSSRPKLEKRPKNTVKYKKGEEIKHAAFGIGIVEIAVPDHNFISVKFGVETKKFDLSLFQAEKTGKVIDLKTTYNKNTKVGRTPKTPLEKFLAQYTKIGLSEEQALEIARSSKIFPDLK